MHLSQDKEKLCCFDARNQQCHVPGGALSALTIRVKKDGVEGVGALDPSTLAWFCHVLSMLQIQLLLQIENW
jgi:hypothetical protein